MHYIIYQITNIQNNKIYIGKHQTNNLNDGYFGSGKHNFDPQLDIKRNTFGVIELAGNKSALAKDIHKYFHQRDEDANTLG